MKTHRPLRIICREYAQGVQDYKLCVCTGCSVLYVVSVQMVFRIICRNFAPVIQVYML